MGRRFFSPRLVNGPEGDPALHVELIGEGRALLFDLGRVDRLKPAELLRIHFVFVSHTHFDHFYGFDHLLRLRIGHERPLRLFGPPGFLENVEGKLGGYTWNLVEGQLFELEAVEVHEGKTLHKVYRCRDGFRSEGPPEAREAPDGLILKDGTLSVFCTTLDHRIPSLAFKAVEKDRINVNPKALAALGMPPGKWVGELKRAVERGKPPDFRIHIGRESFSLGDLEKKLIHRTPGEKIAYVADAGNNKPNIEKIVRLAAGADHFFCEGGFLKRDAGKAHENFHLTAGDAGELARRAGAKRLTIFHFSPKYMGCFPELKEESWRAFRGEKEPGKGE